MYFSQLLYMNFLNHIPGLCPTLNMIKYSNLNFIFFQVLQMLKFMKVLAIHSYCYSSAFPLSQYLFILVWIIMVINIFLAHDWLQSWWNPLVKLTCNYRSIKTLSQPNSILFFIQYQGIKNELLVFISWQNIKQSVIVPPSTALCLPLLLYL